MRVSEIFFSIQGEGTRAGRPCVLVRFAGCDRRCSYCDTAYAFEGGEERTQEEILAEVARFPCRLLTLTGGEPLVRRDLERLVAMLAGLGGLDLTLTTNGALMATQARVLRQAGLQRVTVSLDSLDDSVFRRMNDADFPVRRVLEGIEAAAAAGLSPIKVNMVVKRATRVHKIHTRNSG